MPRLKKNGRPPDFEKKFIGQAEKLCILGATDYELADFFGVSTRTIYRWKNTHEEFCQAVKVGKDKSDERVERALFNRAVGYSYESEKVFQFQGEIVRAATIEHVPPDPAAAFNWLKNRRPEQWRDKTEQVVRHEHANQLSDDELARIATGSSDGNVAPKGGPSKLN